MRIHVGYLMALAALLTAAAACGSPIGARLAQSRPAAAQALQPGDAWGGMNLTRGAQGATSLWALCRPATIPFGRSETDCRVPAAPLAIGPDASLVLALPCVGAWERLTWTMTLDGRPVDLGAFGQATWLLPRKAISGREAYHVSPGWEVNLSPPSPGAHVLVVTASGLQHSGQPKTTLTAATEWVVRFSVDPAASDAPVRRSTFENAAGFAQPGAPCS